MEGSTHEPVVFRNRKAVIAIISRIKEPRRGGVLYVGLSDEVLLRR